jgi:hypothetical protein
MQRKRVDVTMLAAALLVLLLLVWARGLRQGAPLSDPSTYDTGRSGYAALYDLLAREDVAVQRFELPIGQLQSSSGTFVLAGDGSLDAATSARGALPTLDRWVRGGGRLVLLDGQIRAQARKTLAVPSMQRGARRDLAMTGCAFVPPLRAHAVAGTFGGGFPPACGGDRATLLRSASRAAALLYRHGKGSIAIFSNAAVFDNVHLSQRMNARIAYAVFANAAPVRFDERIYGHAAGKSFWDVLPAPMRAAIVIALAALLLGVIGANLPFAPPSQTASWPDRDSSEYIASLARMLARGGACSEAIARIRARCEHVLAPRVRGDERARMLLRELRTLEFSPRPGSSELLAAGRIFMRVRKDYGC